LDPIERNRAFQVLSPSLERSVLADRTFTGREDLLEELAASLGAGTATAITQAIAGLGDGRDEPGGGVCLPASGRPAG
jgi:hypothetical protein